MNCSTDDEMFFDQTDLPAVIRSLKSSTGIKTIKNIKVAVDFLSEFDISVVEAEILIHVVPMIPQTLGLLFERNNNIANLNNKEEFLEEIRTNLQNGITLLDCCTEIIDYTLKFESIEYASVPSIPVNILKVLDLTFGYCKNSQENYNSDFRMLSEILDLFKKGQELHFKFLSLTENYLVFDSLAEDEMKSLQQVLEIMWKIGTILSNMNIKSMADNWKGFANITQKYSDILMINSFDLKSPILKLIEELEIILQGLVESNGVEAKKTQQSIKKMGFFIKIIIKLLDVHKLQEYNKLCLRFLTTIYSYPKELFLYNCVDIDLILQTFQLVDPFLERLMIENEWLKTFHEDSNINNFGMLNLVNKILRNYRHFIVNKPHSFELCYQVFKSVKHCYKDMFNDYNSEIFNDLICNIAVIVLLSPDYYENIEELFLTNATSSNLWAALLSIDSWCLVLKHCDQETVLSTFTSLMRKLSKGNYRKNDVIFIRIFVEKLFTLLPENVRNNQITKFSNMWKIISLNVVPLSQRYHIEFVLNDIYDRANSQLSTDDVFTLATNFGMLSTVDFNRFGINTCKLSSVLIQLWCYEPKDLSIDDDFYVYFVRNLAQFTANNIYELSPAELLQVMRLLQKLKNGTLFKLILSEMMLSIMKRNFNELQQVLPLLSQIGDICQDFINDNNPFVVDIILRATEEMPHIFLNKIQNSSPQVKQLLSFYEANKHSKTLLNLTYLDQMKSSQLQHKCVVKKYNNIEKQANALVKVTNGIERKNVAILEDQDDEMPSKRIKMDNEFDEALCELKSAVKKLVNVKGTLNNKQRMDVKSIILKMESFITQ